MKKLLILLIILACALPAFADSTPRGILSSMTLEQKVGQLFMIRPEALNADIPGEKARNANGVKKVSGGMIDFYRSYPAGGIILFGKNLSGADQLTRLTADLHAMDPFIPPLIAIDEEGGKIARIANSGLFRVPVFPNMQKIASGGDRDQAYAAGSGIGAYLREYGIDATFAPVADVNTNPNNPVIGARAFGSDPRIAAIMVESYLNGLHASGVMGCVKHFPGHGDTNSDTHSGYAATNKTWIKLLSCEMIPFISGINAGTDMVMVAHIAAPEITGDKTPATLSPVIITEKLRGELGYNGVVITDGMEMGAITGSYSSSKAAIRSILAGSDIILLPLDYPAAFKGVLSAVREGTIPESRIDESVLRVLTLKQKYGLL